MLCAQCWRDASIDHEKHAATRKHVVTGRIAAPKHVSPARLLQQIDRALTTREHCQLYAPGLCAAAGLEARAQVDRRRFDLLTGN